MNFKSNSSNVGPDMVQASSGGGGFIDRVGKLFGGIAGHRNSMELIEHRAKWDAAGKMSVTRDAHEAALDHQKRADTQNIQSHLEGLDQLANYEAKDAKGKSTGKTYYNSAADAETKPFASNPLSPLAHINKDSISRQATINYGSPLNPKKTGTTPTTVNDTTVGDTGGVGATGGVKSNKKFAIPNPSRSKGNKNGNKRRSNVKFGGKK